MTTSIPLSELGSSPSAKFEKIGDKFVGRIVAMDRRSQTDPVTGAVKTFADGSPRPVLVITIEQADGETVALWARGGNYEPAQGHGESMMAAIGTAIRAAGANSLDEGAMLGVAHTGLGKANGPGMNAPLLFAAQYQPPAQSIPADDLFAGTGNTEPF